MLKLNHLAGFGAATEARYQQVPLLVQPSSSDVTIYDRYGNAVTNNNVTLNAADIPFSGIKSMDFTSSNSSYISIDDNPSFDAAGDFTFELWVKAQDHAQDTGYQRRIVASSYTGNSWEIAVQSSDSGGVVFYSTGGTQPPTPPLNDGSWHLLTVERVGSAIAMARDGVFSASLTKSAPLSVEGPLIIGRRPDNAWGHFFGKIAGIRLTTGVSRHNLTNFTPVMAPW